MQTRNYFKKEVQLKILNPVRYCYCESCNQTENLRNDILCQSSCFCLVLCLGNETASGNTHTFTTQSNRFGFPLWLTLQTVDIHIDTRALH